MKTLLMFTAAMAMAAQAQAEVKYTASALRDPFSGEVTKSEAPDEAASLEDRLRQLTIQGIVASAKNPRAIINGKIYRVGSEPAPGVKIMGIGKDGVRVLAGEKESLLTRQSQPIRGKADELPKQP